jgi:hypothetical protein
MWRGAYSAADENLAAAGPFVVEEDSADRAKPVTFARVYGHPKRAKREKRLISANSTELAGNFNQFAAIGAEINGDTRRLLDSATEAASLGGTDLRSNHLANSFAAFAQLVRIGGGGPALLSVSGCAILGSDD